MSQYVIGIDIGTSSTKAIALDITGKILSTAQLSYTTQSILISHCEQDALVVYDAFLYCVKTITSDLKRNPGAIILSSAMHSLIAVDAEGNALAPMIIWSDNRSASIAQHLKDSALGEMLYEETGTPIHAMSPLCKIIWLRENLPSIFRKTVKFISVKDFIWHKLFNVFETDHSIASASGLMNIQTLQWSINALDVAQITEKHLPSLIATNTVRKSSNAAVCSQIGILQDTAFIVGASDGCFANLGSFAYTPGVAALTIGTSGAIRVAGKSPLFNYKAMIFNYRLDEQTFISGGPTNNGGVVLKWYAESFLKRSLNTIEDYTNLLRGIAHTPDGAEGLIFLPYLFGERAPLWNSDASGLFFGIRNHHTQDHFTRAVIEGISMALYDIADNLKAVGISIPEIHVSGGFVRSTTWLQILANIFNTKIVLVNSADASAMGAAFLGMKTLGLIENYESLKRDIAQEFTPDEGKVEVYKKQFIRFRQVYQSVMPLMHNEID